MYMVNHATCFSSLGAKKKKVRKIQLKKEKQLRKIVKKRKKKNRENS